MTAKAAKITFHDAYMWVALVDERVIGLPLRWFPRLNDAARVHLENYQIYETGIHWPDLDEDLSVDGIIEGRRAPPRADAEDDDIIVKP